MDDETEKSTTFIGAIAGVAVAAVCLLTVCLLMVKCCYKYQRRKNAATLPPMASYDTLKRTSELQEKNLKTDASLNLIDNELYETSNHSPIRKTADMPDLDDPSANVYENVS